MKESFNSKWEIISSRLAGDSILDDQAFHLWLQSDAENRALWVELKALWRKSYEAGLLHQIDVQKDWKSVAGRIHRTKQKRFNLIFGFTTAALILLFIGLSIVLLNTILTPKSRWEHFAVSDQNSSSILLDDGSKVDVNRGSQFFYLSPFTNYERRVRLKGEAFFDVKKSQEAPFYIEAGQFRIRVVGTAFNVSNTGNSFEVNVVKGSVIVQNMSRENDITLVHGGESVRFDTNVNRLVWQPEQDSNCHAWRTRHIVFRNNTLDNVVQTLESVYGIQVDVTNELALKNLALTAAFNHDDLPNVIRVIEVTLDVEFQFVDINRYLLKSSH